MKSQEKKYNICPICKKKFRARGRRKYCNQECAKKANAKNALKRAQRIQAEHSVKEYTIKQMKKENSVLRAFEPTINEIAAEAKRHGMSYGYFVGLMWLKKTREQEVHIYSWM